MATVSLRSITLPPDAHWTDFNALLLPLLVRSHKKASRLIHLDSATLGLN